MIAKYTTLIATFFLHQIALLIFIIVSIFWEYLQNFLLGSIWKEMSKTSHIYITYNEASYVELATEGQFQECYYSYIMSQMVKEYYTPHYGSGMCHGSFFLI